MDIPSVLFEIIKIDDTQFEIKQESDFPDYLKHRLPAIFNLIHD